jgi:hypothetical protein
MKKFGIMLKSFREVENNASLHVALKAALPQPTTTATPPLTATTVTTTAATAAAAAARASVEEEVV